MTHIERKNWGLIRDLLITDGSPTAMGLAALIAGGALIGTAGYAAYQNIRDYFTDREQQLEEQLQQVRRTRAELDDMPDDKSSPLGAHGVYR